MRHRLVRIAVSLAPLALLAALQDPRPLPPAHFGALVTCSGDNSKVAAARTLRVTDAGTWAKLWLEHLGQPIPDGDYGWYTNHREIPEIDFEHCTVVAVCRGKRRNEIGLRAVEAFVHDGTTTLRLDPKSVQSIGAAMRTQPFGFFVLPRVDGAIVVEENAQNRIGGEPIWREIARLE
ncbi:MAG: hypothetical protein KDE27_19785 [Planctomycetes bacterium]|nr:hypothetical protein [Planctomycetota bacterium]